MLAAFELLAIFSLFGLYDSVRFKWCWRVVGSGLLSPSGLFAGVGAVLAPTGRREDGVADQTSHRNGYRTERGLGLVHVMTGFWRLR